MGCTILLPARCFLWVPRTLRYWDSAFLKEKDVILILKKLDSLVGQYRDYEYLDRSGEARLLGNGYHFLKDAKDYSYHLENYPLAKELREFYETEIKSHEVLMEMEALLFIQGRAYDAGAVFYRAVWGKPRLSRSLCPSCTWTRSGPYA